MGILAHGDLPGGRPPDRRLGWPRHPDDAKPLPLPPLLERRAGADPVLCYRVGGSELKTGIALSGLLPICDAARAAGSTMSPARNTLYQRLQEWEAEDAIKEDEERQKEWEEKLGKGE